MREIEETEKGNLLEFRGQPRAEIKSLTFSSLKYMYDFCVCMFLYIIHVLKSQRTEISECLEQPRKSMSFHWEERFICVCICVHYIQINDNVISYNI